MENRKIKDVVITSQVSPNASSDGMGWIGVQAARYLDTPTMEVSVPPLAYHTLLLVTRPPEKMYARYEGVKREKAPPRGSITILPAALASEWSWRGTKDCLHVHLEPSLFSRVASESFEIDPARMEVLPLQDVDIPELRAAMLAVDAQLSAGGVGGSLVMESLANLLSLQMIRHVTGARRRLNGPDGVLPRRKLKTVIEYINENLESSPTLGQMAAAAHLSPYHFARQFKTATGLPPHQYVIARRVERAQELLRRNDEICLSEVALSVGFSDQSQFTFHFKRIIGVTPGQFRTSARIA
jgi:AraC family transcriptional regulator